MNSEQPIEIEPTPNFQSASIVKQVNSEGEKQYMTMQNRYEVEKDAIFINYDKDEMIHKLKDYTSLEIYQRMSFSRHINVIRNLLNQEEPELVGAFIRGLVLQGEQIKRYLIQELKEACAKIIQESEVPEVYLEIKNVILPTLLDLLKCGILDIKEDAGTLLGSLSPKLKQEQFQSIVKGANALLVEKQQDNKIVGLEILSKLSQSAPLNFVENLVCKQLLLSASSDSIRVKKEALLCFPRVCSKVSDKFFETELLPFYLKKCTENAWSVRKACVQIITSLLTKAITIKERSLISTEMLSFLKDGNKLVKIHAHKILPLYISLLTFNHPQHPDDLSYKLLEQYFKLIDSDVNNLAMSNEIIYELSYYFPAVLLTLGKQYWNKMFPIYNRLLRHTQVRIRKPLAYSFHQIAKIIGEQPSKTCLFQCLDNILKDHYDYLKLGAIGHLAQFVEIFNSQVKQNLVDVFLVLQKDPKKWRIRHSIASQLDQLIKIYDSDTVLKYILPISLKLCNDPVAQVSYQASKHVWVVLQSLKQEASFKLVIQSITGYAQSNRYNQRQIFLQIVKHFSIYDNSFEELIIPELKILATDKIPLVRICVSEVIANLNQKMKKLDKIIQIIQILQKDPDEDVRNGLNLQQ